MPTNAEKNLAALQALQNPNPDRDDLLGFVGWGCCSHVLTVNTDLEDQSPDALVSRQLPEFMNQDEIDAARASMLNAYYTPPHVIKLMWEIVAHLGFQGGTILEPSCGTLRFLEHQPQHIRKQSKWVAVEADPMSATISRTLYPEATVYSSRFERCSLPANAFDLVIGNVPFGDTTPADPIYNAPSYNIHSYFIHKSVHLLRPGGLMALISGQGTMDSKSSQGLREWMAKNGELLLAFRLPSDAHEGAGASCDILIYRKKEGERTYATPSWTKTATVLPDYTGRNLVTYGEDEKPSDPTAGMVDGSAPLTINHYYHDNPTHLLGKLATMSRYLHKRLEVQNSGIDLAEVIQPAYKRLRRCYTPAGEKEIAILPPEYQHLPQGAYIEMETDSLEDGPIMQIKGTRLVPVLKSRWDPIRKALALLDVYMALIDHERRSADDVRADALRQQLQEAYFAFTDSNGYLNANKALLAEDPRLLNLLALESKQDDGGYVPVGIFFKRTIRPFPDLTRCDDPADALLASLNRHGTINKEYISELLGHPEEDPMQILASRELVYFDPALQKFVLKDEYLSGDVKTKLAEAIEAQLEANVSALKKALPPPVLPPGDLAIQQACAIALDIPLNAMSDEARQELFSETLLAQLGAIWIPEDVIVDFIIHLMGSEDVELDPGYIRVRHIDRPFSTWSVNCSHHVINAPANTQKWGNRDRNGLELLEQALNFKDPKVHRTDSDGKTYVDQQATEACRAKIEEIREEFNAWLWREKTRAVRMALLYNEKVNRYRVREYDGSHLTFPGSSPHIELRRHQKNGVWRILNQSECEGTLIGHGVGLGKTMLLAATCMEARRLGIASKPVVCVMNDTIPGVIADCRRLYPQAVILSPDNDGMKGDGRQVFINRLATEDYDMAIIPHSLLFDIPVSERRLRDHLEQEIGMIAEALGLANDLSRSAKRKLEKRKQTLRDKIEVITESKRKRKSSLTWEQLGVDMFILDESQVVKKLGFVTTQEVAGLDTSESQRGRDTKLKIESVFENGGKVIFSTGTPVTNTLAELFTLMRYLIPRKLDEMNIASFDAWASLFAQTQTSSEVAAEGTYQVKTRFSLFTNLPELFTLYWSFADLVTSADLTLERPDPLYFEVRNTPNEQQLAYMQHLQDRAREIRARKVDPEDDNLLVVVNDGRKSAVDMRLVMENADDDPESKLNSAVWSIWRIWQESAPVKGTQFVFANIGTPSTDLEMFDVYREIEAKLVALGIPSREIAFVHDAKNPAQKAKLFRRVNEGKVRVLLGSTAKGGTGVNVQSRLVALHHIEADWRPADITQREGRIIRQGNLFKECLILRHITEGVRGMAGFDAFFWQKLTQKSRFITQIEQKKLTSRHSEDIGDVTLNFTQVMAIASGDPMLKDESDLQSELKRLELRQSAHRSQQASLAWELNDAVKKVDASAAIEEQMMLNLAKSQEFDGIVTIGKQKFQDPKKMGGAILERVKDAFKLSSAKPMRVGRIESIGFDIYIMRGLRDDVGGFITNNIQDEYSRYSFHINRTSPTMTANHLLDLVQTGLEQALETFREATATAKVKMKELSNIRQEPFPQAGRIEEIRAKLKEIAARKKELEALAKEEAQQNKGNGTGERVRYGQAPLLPPSRAVIQALRERSEHDHPEWLAVLPRIIEGMRPDPSNPIEVSVDMDEDSPMQPVIPDLWGAPVVGIAQQSSLF